MSNAPRTALPRLRSFCYEVALRGIIGLFPDNDRRAK